MTRGFTVVEALVAVMLLAVVAAAALALQAQALRATRAAEVRRTAAAALRAEVALQRALGGVTGTCTGAVPAGWGCAVEAACAPRPSAACDLRTIVVRLEPASGPALIATTAVHRPLTGGAGLRGGGAAVLTGGAAVRTGVDYPRSGGARSAGTEP